MQQAMGDLEALLADIRRRAQQQGLDVETGARQRAEAVLAAAEPNGAELADALLREAARDTEALRLRILSQGELDARHRFIQARERILDSVWREVEARLRQLVTTPGYARVLESLAQLAARELASRRVVLAADPAGHRLLTQERLASWGRQVGVSFESAEEPANTWGGLLAYSGRERYDATLSGRLELAREVLREQVFEQLDRSRE